jgi:predicted ATP-grasp superfamily ATP-dependent carboligase
VVIKPASTEKSNPLTKAKAWKAETEADYAQKYQLATDYMGPGGFVVQELIPGGGESQFSYAGLWDHGTEVCGLTARRSRQFPAEFGTSPFVETTEQPRVLAEAQALLKAVNYHGLVEVEFKLDARDDRLKLLDVNTRIWAWIGLGAAAGLDFPILTAAVATSTMSGHPQPTYGASWLRFVPNALSLLQSLQRTGNLGYAAGRSLSPFAGPAIFAFDDPMPALLELPIQVLRRL